VVEILSPGQTDKQKEQIVSAKTEVDQMSLVPTDVTQRSLWTVESPRLMRAAGFDYEHEIRVALPVGYASTDRTYPVLWVTDNSLELALSVLGSAQLILVAVGGGAIPVAEFGRRRCFDFYPTEDFLSFDDPGSSYLYETVTLPDGTKPKGGGADRFLDFLIDDVRLQLAADYRMEPEDHGLEGFSAGGAFVGHALFARPGAFKRYICGSPALYACNDSAFRLEERYAAAHDDLPAHVFFGAGGAEITEPMINGFGCVSSLARMAEILSFRGYPSLRMKVKIFPGESHATARPLTLRWGVRSVWGEEIFVM
jgi:predicted alpha/beta superfamily hydrolase